MINTLLAELQYEKEILEKGTLEINDVVTTVKRIAIAEEEIMQKVLEIKILKSRLFSSKYVPDKEMVSQLTSNEILALENSLDMDVEEFEALQLVKVDRINEESALMSNVIDNDGDVAEKPLEKIQMSSYYGEMGRGGLKYIGDEEVNEEEIIEDEEEIDARTKGGLKFIGYIIKEEEEKLHAEKAMDASLDDAVDELEENIKEEKEIKEILGEEKQEELQETKIDRIRTRNRSVNRRRPTPTRR